MRASPGVNDPLLPVLSVIVIIGLLAGCGGGDKDATPTPTASALTVTPSAAPAAPGSLAAKLLTNADLSSDWQAGGSGTFGPRTTFCGLRLPVDLEPQDSVSSNFTNKRNGFALAQYISRYEKGKAETVLAEYRKAIEPCEVWNVPAAVGNEAHYAVSVLEIDGNAGDDIFGFKVTLPVEVEVSPIADQSAQLEIHVVLTRFVDLVTWLVYGGLPADGLPVEQTEGFLRLAASRVEQTGED
jgi:hypothetical protein